MLSSDMLPLIREAANRVYSVVRETPLVPLPRDARMPGEYASGIAEQQLGHQLEVPFTLF